jgi:ornithine decarboxylase
MHIPIQRYFRILVVGKEAAPVAPIIEETLGFRVESAASSEAREAIYNGADLCAIIVDRHDAEVALAARRERGFEMPVFLLSERSTEVFDAPYLSEVSGVLVRGLESREFYKKTLLTSVEHYVGTLLTPFFGTLLQYDHDGNRTWACPGHQGGQMFRRHPVGRLFFDHLGENVFRDDICNAMVSLGDLLIHEGPALQAQQEAARIFGADRTYFMLNGTSSSNKAVNTALLRDGDVVLFDRNNHKSNHQGALMLAGAIPIYLETDRNGFGMVGPIDWSALDEKVIRARIAAHPLLAGTDAATRERPIRVAIIEQCTYDGTLYDARKIVAAIGHLCEYIHFDEAWAGFGAFHPLLHDHYAMGLVLGENDPGIIATQSTHKQLAGFSQASQIHVRDEHIRGKPWRVNHKRLNEMVLMQASTSPFYPLFSSLDVNAQMHRDRAGRVLWDDMVRIGIEARKAVRKHLSGFLDPFVPDFVEYEGALVRWEEVPTDVLAREQRYWQLDASAMWHGYRNLGETAAMVDPTKLMLTTRGIDPATGEYEETGIPATVLANYLRAHHIIPEKNDLNSILFLLTPAVGEGKTAFLLAELERFRALYEADAPLAQVVPSIATRHVERYAGYGLRELCDEMHGFYRDRGVKELQRLCFRHESFPEQAMRARDAVQAMVAGEVEYVPMAKVKGRIAATLALIYPPGIGIIVPGERYDDAAQPMIDYFLVFEEAANRFPGFSCEVQGVYSEPDNGGVRFHTYVVNEHAMGPARRPC